MKISYFETGRYKAPPSMPGIWPMPSGAYDRDEGARVYQGMVERVSLAEKLGFDWVSLSEHHYSPRILTPSPPVAAAYVAARVPNIKIALLGPIVAQTTRSASPRSWRWWTPCPTAAWSSACCAARPTKH